VSDDGVGADENEIRKYIAGDSPRASFALKNIHERLKLEYGEGYDLEFYSMPGKGTMVQILLPIVMDTGRINE
jgi:two-component system sensor histidine kinase YesM